MEQVITTLCDRVTSLLENNPPSSHRRILIALAGVPGSGKSTISAGLASRFNENGKLNVAILPMDGFHYSKSQLLALQSSSTENLLQRRGAPFTFDAQAFVDLVRCLRQTPVTEIDDPSMSFYVPSFDHKVKDPIENDICIPSSQRIIILEGNYLLLDEEPWNEIRDLVDEAWFVSVSRETAKRRLIKRHILAGIESTVEAAAKRAEENDLINGDLITRKMIFPNVIVENIDCRDLI
ncbi:phosphoribulokinase/uridine kinase [Xylogone sp. PMI_703]|nr:phosphoribulokinase/uridine kinase [Xylogone sp. PMI_703]